MATISKSKLTAVRYELQQFAMDALKQFNRFGGLEPLTMVVPTSVPTVNFKWLSRIGKVREWLGERELGEFEAFDYSLSTKNWEMTVGIDRYEIEVDNLGVYRPQIEAMVQDGAEHAGQILAALLNNGFSGLGYDGKAFFADDHPMRQSDGSVANGDNKGTAALAEASLLAALLVPAGWNTPQGTKMNIRYDTLVVPPALETEARKLRDVELYIHPSDSAVDVNMARGMVPNIIVNPYLSSTTAWFLFDSTKAGIKPLIYQELQPWQFDMVTDPDDSHVFLTRQFLFGMDARYNVGYGLWQVAYGSTGAA